MLAFLAFAQIESVLPDICDGDATATELAAFDGATDLPHNAVVLSQASVNSVPANDDGSAPASSHGAHTCHCVHVHGGALAQSADGMTGHEVGASRVSVARYLAPFGVTIEPRLRPPLG